jgi:hypothetical protein
LTKSKESITPPVAISPVQEELLEEKTIDSVEEEPLDITQQELVDHSSSDADVMALFMSNSFGLETVHQQDETFIDQVDDTLETSHFFVDGFSDDEHL